ncbi:MAG TPA: DUF4157 domain-containing protein [Flavitalea sp.]|nr:DUF4157 domain-containing protein [Flavitalea sp.]
MNQKQPHVDINSSVSQGSRTTRFFSAKSPHSISEFFIQPKLTINHPNDPYEQEADAMADKVMRMEDPSIQRKSLVISSLQRKCAECEEEEDHEIQRKTIDSGHSARETANTTELISLLSPDSPVQRKCDACEEEEKIQRKEADKSGTEVGSTLENYLGTLSGSGHGLPEQVRGFYEPRFGYDFGSVKIHTDDVAAKSAQSINALAYTSGNNIVFNSGQYSPGSTIGKKLLGHELTHVVQQGKSGNKVNRLIQRRLIVSGGNEALVREYLTLVGSASGLNLNWAFGIPRVTVAGNLAGPVPSPQGRTSILRVINHPTQHAELHIGINQPTVSVGAFPGGGSTIQNIDIDDIRNLNASLPGQGTGKAFHEMMENFNAHGIGFANFNPSHAVGLENESNVLEDQGIVGRRLSGALPNTPIAAPAGQPVGPNITYFRQTQNFTHYFLEIIQRRTTGSPTGPGADFEVVSARRVPKVQVSQRTVDSFVSGSNAVPPAGNVILATTLADLNANPNSTVLLEGFADSVGTAEGNVGVSRNRAATAQAFFIANGISANRIAIVGRGETNFVATNANEAGRLQNRRIVMTVHRPGP